MHTLSDPNSVVLAGDIMDWATLKTNQITTLVKLVVGAMVLVAIGAHECHVAAHTNRPTEAIVSISV